MTPSFNLVDEPWIRALRSGKPVDLSIVDAFEQAHEVELSVAAPLELAAILRQVLLPVYVRAVGPPTTLDEWGERLRHGTVDLVAVRDYLDRWRHRFDLFSPEMPFAQVAGLRTAKGETKPSSLLRADLATGNNVPLFSERTEANPPALTPAEAARALLATQCWDTAAIKTGALDDPAAKAGKTTGNPTGPLGGLGVVIPWGRTLAETLILNTPVLLSGLRSNDKPQWESEPLGPGWTTRSALGLLDLWTWQARRIRLFSDGNGHSMSTVSRVLVAAGDRLDPLPIDIEPHTLWQPIKVGAAGKASPAPQRPRRHQPGKSAWRGMEALLAAEDGSSLLIQQLAKLEIKDSMPPGVLPRVVTVGVVYGNQSAVVEDVISDMIPLPADALRSESETRAAIREITDCAEQLRLAGNRLSDDLRRACGADALPWDQGQRPGDALIHDLDPWTRRFLAALQRSTDIESISAAWRTKARTLALDLLGQQEQAAGPRGFLGQYDSKAKRWRRASVAVAAFRHRLNELIPADHSDDQQQQKEST